jgi:hypothetical protein
MVAACLRDFLAVDAYRDDEHQHSWGGEDVHLIENFMHAGYHIWRVPEPGFFHEFHEKRAWGGRGEAIAPAAESAVRVYIYNVPTEFTDQVLDDSTRDAEALSARARMGLNEWDCTKNMFSLEVHFPRL